MRLTQGTNPTRARYSLLLAMVHPALLVLRSFLRRDGQRVPPRTTGR